mmetsp:Transcript_111013/g.353734  ORF Transcript_111013/g.353734 Transcript_111013/m.353734 type:complete len:751 (-) Transcript_111013:216-2468(-)
MPDGQPDALVAVELPEGTQCAAGILGEVSSAAYGAGSCWADVTAQVRRAVEEDEAIHANNDFCGSDPAFGAAKALKVIHLPKRAACGRVLVRPELPLGGGTSLQAMVEAWEGSTLELPPGTVGPIAGATFGAGASWVDVRERVEACVAEDGALRLLVGSELLGGDPLPGVRKSLRISYTLHETRRLIADHCDWEVYEDFVVDGINGSQGAPAATMEDLLHARRRCLLLGCGGFWLSTGTVNQFGDEDGPPGCNMLRATQGDLCKRLRNQPPGPSASSRNRALRPGVHIAPREFQADPLWRPGFDAAPAPHITWLPKSQGFCAFAMQIRVPPEGVSDCTFYMCGGFFCGYAGIQQLGGKGQAVLFSVWNAGSGGRATTLEVGGGAEASNFGGEGMGVGAPLFYPPEKGACWIPGNTYTFVVRAIADGDATLFSCHFHKPEEGRQWRLIARHRRPDPSAAVHGLLGNPGGFIEDFGHTAALRSGEWGPCWVQRFDGTWEPVVRCVVKDGCGRPNKAAYLTEDRRRVVMLAGGEAMDENTVLFDGEVVESAPPDILNSVPGPLPTHNAAGLAADLREAPDEDAHVVEFNEWDIVKPLSVPLVAAVWGAGGVWVNVKQKVDSLLGQGSFQASYVSLGDPVPGQQKFLRIKVPGRLAADSVSRLKVAADGSQTVPNLEEVSGASEVLIEFREGDVAEPMDAPLLAAVWGEGSTWFDVRDKVDSLFSQGSFQVSFVTLGDPVPGQVKTLRIKLGLS